VSIPDIVDTSPTDSTDQHQQRIGEVPALDKAVLAGGRLSINWWERIIIHHPARQGLAFQFKSSSRAGAGGSVV
jgi:hypothetical protein